ncbi:outer membrane beta-barrel protein [Frateuria edaphi]|uniref:outer membrane beta-barrel protein n=1 Tax=Frateuria edaphi TaxID=2898793 RepID=UPI001E2CD76C|nr:outer membrane beta-barrel protein [Frateuria edaphi]UGB46247.1 outer membrane beta-barrel protein [Frateuria edaphi]
MNKYVLSLSALILAGACSSAFAQDNRAFFVNAAAGQATYHVDDADGDNYAGNNSDSATSLRLGYLWHGPVDIGVEGGYVDLGQLKASLISGAVFEEATVHAKGWLLGAAGKYHFADQWFVSARGGWLRASSDVDFRISTPADSTSASSSVDGNGWYGGVGVGYDFSDNVSLGVNYDNYHVKAQTDGVSADANVGTWMVTAEYRF